MALTSCLANPSLSALRGQRPAVVGASAGLALDKGRDRGMRPLDRVSPLQADVMPAPLPTPLPKVSAARFLPDVEVDDIPYFNDAAVLSDDLAKKEPLLPESAAQESEPRGPRTKAAVLADAGDGGEGQRDLTRTDNSNRIDAGWQVAKAPADGAVFAGRRGWPDSLRVIRSDGEGHTTRQSSPQIVENVGLEKGGP